LPRLFLISALRRRARWQKQSPGPQPGLVRPAHRWGWGFGGRAVPDRKILDEARNEDFDADQYPRSCTTSRLRCSSFKLSTDIAAALTFPGSCCTRSRLRCLWLRSSSSATAAFGCCPVCGLHKPEEPAALSDERKAPSTGSSCPISYGRFPGTRTQRHEGNQCHCSLDYATMSLLSGWTSSRRSVQPGGFLSEFHKNSSRAIAPDISSFLS